MPNSFLSTTVWAVTPDYLDKIDAVLSAHLTGEKLDLQAIEAGLGHRLENEKKPYQVVDAVAVIPVIGAVGKRMNLLMRISGGVSTELLQADIQAALDDREVQAIVLRIDSPGGTVDGTMELADWLRGRRGQKPIYAYADGLIASAAYWFGSSADKLYGYATASVGSIGVVVTHYDLSEQDKSRGVKRTMVTAGKYKRIAADNEPLSVAGREYLQDMVDGIYSLFVDGVAANRGVDAETVLRDMADGRVFLAAEAKARGMLDALGTLEDTINAARAAAKEQYNQKVTRMNAKELKEKYPDAAAALLAEGRESAREQATAEKDQAVQSALGSETGRLLGVYGMLHGAAATEKFKTLAAAGLTAEQIKALEAAGLSLSGSTSAAAPAAATPAAATPAAADEEKTRKELLAALRDETGQADPGALPAGSLPAGTGRADFEALVDEHLQANAGMRKSAAIQALAKKHPDLYEAWLARANQK